MTHVIAELPTQAEIAALPTKADLLQMVRSLDEHHADQLRVFDDKARAVDDRLATHVADPTAHAAK